MFCLEIRRLRHYFCKLDHLIMWVILIIITWCGPFIQCSTQVGYISLKTKYGLLIGTQEKIELTSATDKYVNNNQPNQHNDLANITRKYYAYRGLPYAEPPVGHLRWQDTIVKGPIHGFFNATTSQSPCPQWHGSGNTTELIGNEDCLYANIFIPANAKKRLGQRLKILVFIHGGGFIKNSNRNTSPDPIMFEENCILIMFNYRISVFGYLSTGTKDLPGNYGALDQIALLKWVQTYAVEFGGDPNSVTLLGTSIGAISVHYLMLTKLASGLFHRAILGSGSAFCERSLAPSPLSVAKIIGSKLGCKQSAPAELVSCMRSHTMLDLMIVTKSLTIEFVLPSVLGPVIDKTSRYPAFLLEHPEKLPVVNKVPTVLGITKNEGLTPFVKLSQQYTIPQMNDLHFIQSTILPKYLNLIMRVRDSPPRHEYVHKLTYHVMEFYKSDFSHDPVSALVAILGDLWVQSCHRKTMEKLCFNRVPSVFAYLFTHHDAGVSPSEIDMEIKEFHQAGINHPILDNGVSHTEDIHYVMQHENPLIVGSENKLQIPRNRLMSQILSTLWTSFVNDENLNSVTERFNWPRWHPICQIGKTDPYYSLYEISLDNHRMMRNFRLNESNFWTNIHRDTFVGSNKENMTYYLT